MFGQDLSIRQRDYSVRKSTDDRVMGDNDRGCTKFTVNAFRSHAEPRFGFHIERAGWLIAEQYSGCLAIALAMATRCCSPPESWEGK